MLICDAHLLCMRMGSYLFSIQPVQGYSVLIMGSILFCKWVGLYFVMRMGLLFDTRPAGPNSHLITNAKWNLLLLSSKPAVPQ